jgi:hypothetical protein
MRTDIMMQRWDAYRETQISRELHPDDHMFNAAKTGWSEYLGVGESAAECITYVLSGAPSGDVRKFMDFGCGHGRIARHLRALFPAADAVFVDIDPAGSGFCATTFGGSAITSIDDFDKLTLPGNLDLIWLGSIFTHLDRGRMIALLNVLTSSLSRHGVVAGTFRGETMYKIMKEDSAKNRNTELKWRSLLQQYEANGFGYAPYSSDTPQWGLSLSTVSSVFEIGRSRADLKMIAYREAGWAGAHDVAAWARML